MPGPELSILMPVFEEEATVERAIDRVLEADVGTESYELSTDRTAELLDGRNWPEQVRVILDADLEYDPNDPSDLRVPVRERVADAAFGTRAFRAHSAYSFW